MSHTKGPWNVEIVQLNSIYAVRSASLAKGHWGTVAHVPVRDSHPEHGGAINRATAVANARLIAAAPDLLSALQNLGDWLAYGLNKADGAEPTTEDHATAERLAAAARAAISKATCAA